jgi:threonyl-tRNA synthetase
MIVKNEVQKYIKKLDKKYKFQEVLTPAFGSVDLYKTSGH